MDLILDNKKFLADGSLRVSAYLASYDSVYKYSNEFGINGGVYRPESVIASSKALSGLDGLSVTLHHPFENGRAVLVDSSNAMRFTRGFIKGSGFKDESLKKIGASLVIKDKMAIDAVLNGAAKGISLGYKRSEKKEAGVTNDGQKYDYVLTFVEYNHAALTPTPRGSDAYVLDSSDLSATFDSNYTSEDQVDQGKFIIYNSFDSKKKEGKKVVKRKLKNGTVIDVPDDFEATLDSIIDTYESEVKELKTSLDSKDGAIASLQSDLDKANESINQMNDSSGDITKAIEIAALWDTAKHFIGDSAKLSDFNSVSEIKRAALSKHYSVSYDSKSDGFIDGAYEALELNRKKTMDSKVSSKFVGVDEAIKKANSERFEKFKLLTTDSKQVLSPLEQYYASVSGGNGDKK